MLVIWLVNWTLAGRITKPVCNICNKIISDQFFKEKSSSSLPSLCLSLLLGGSTKWIQKAQNTKKILKTKIIKILVWLRNRKRLFHVINLVVVSSIFNTREFGWKIISAKSWRWTLAIYYWIDYDTSKNCKHEKKMIKW